MKINKSTAVVLFLTAVLTMSAYSYVLSQKQKGDGNVIKKEIPINSFK